MKADSVHKATEKERYRSEVCNFPSHQGNPNPTTYGTGMTNGAQPDILGDPNVAEPERDGEADQEALNRGDERARQPTKGRTIRPTDTREGTSRTKPRGDEWRPPRAPKDWNQKQPEHNQENETQKNILSSNKYYKLMENGLFDTEAYEEDGVAEMELMPTEKAAVAPSDPPLICDHKKKEQETQVELRGSSSHPSGTAPFL